MSSKNLAYKVIPHQFDKKILVPTSKSYANRALILGAIKGNSFAVKNLPNSTDVENLILCLEKIGLDIKKTATEIVFKNSFPACEKKSSNPIILKTGDGGTTNRFLIALLALGQNEYHLIPSEKMNERPIEDLLIPLEKLSVQVVKSEQNFWVSVKGPMNFNGISELIINCEKSTQFASALKLVLFQASIKIILSNIKSSEKYIHMTDKLISDVNTENEYSIPVDFSSLSYPLALAMASEHNSVTVQNCFSKDDFQADSIFLNLLQKIGGKVIFSEDGLTVSRESELQTFEKDISQCPDLAMTLAFLASIIEGKSILKNLEVLKYKESDRLSGILKMLNLFEVEYKYLDQNYSLEIYGSKKIVESKTVMTERDHRMVMMGYLFLRHHSGGELFNTDCIEKSFPDFLNILL